MKKKLLLATFLCTIIIHYANGAYVPVQISSGFNADVVCNGIGASSSTTTDDVDGVNYAFLCINFQPTSSSPVLTYGLPVDGVINSQETTTSGLSFQMSPFLTPYDGDNSLRIDNVGGSGTLTFQSSISAQKVYILTTSGSGDSYMTGTITFTDATTQSISSTIVPDWFYSSLQPVALSGFGRVLTTTDAVESSFGNPRLYQIGVDILTANQSKQIASVTIEKATGGGTASVLNVFAISIDAVVTCPAPTGLTAGSITTSAASLDWTQSGTAAQWQIKYGSPSFNPSTSGTMVPVTAHPHLLSGLTTNTNYEYYVRAICGPSDTSSWSSVGAFTTLCIAPTVVTKKDSVLCGEGAVTLEATASAGTIKWYAALTGGSALATGNTFITPSIASSTTYYIAAASGTCESSPRQPVTATIKPVPEVDLGNDTTICPYTSYTFDAGNSGAQYVWSTGDNTQTITRSTAGTYSVAVTLNGCGNSDEIIITPGIVPINNLPAVTNLCEGETATLNAGNSGSTYSWSPGGATTQVLDVTSGGVQSVVVTSTDGCAITGSTNVIMRPLPVAYLGNDTSICDGDQITLHAGNPGCSYVWNTGASTQTINIADSGTYSVTVTTAYNCVHTEDRHIAYLPAPFVEGFNFVPLFYGDLGKVQFAPLLPTNVNGYDWDFGDGSPHATQMNPVHIYAASGVYIVTLKVINGCGEFTISLPINVDITTGIVTLNKDQADISVYPNPATSMMSIANKTADITMENVMVFNALGAVVYQHKADNGKQHQLSVTNFASGMYSLRILTDKGYVIRKFEVIR